MGTYMAMHGTYTAMHAFPIGGQGRSPTDIGVRYQEGGKNPPETHGREVNIGSFLSHSVALQHLTNLSNVYTGTGIHTFMEGKSIHTYSPVPNSPPHPPSSSTHHISLRQLQHLHILLLLLLSKAASPVSPPATTFSRTDLPTCCKKGHPELFVY